MEQGNAKDLMLMFLIGHEGETEKKSELILKINNKDWTCIGEISEMYKDDFNGENMQSITLYQDTIISFCRAMEFLPETMEECLKILSIMKEHSDDNDFKKIIEIIENSLSEDGLSENIDDLMNIDIDEIDDLYRIHVLNCRTYAIAQIISV